MTQETAKQAEIHRMTNEQVNQYLQEVLRGAKEPEAAWEKQVAQELRQSQENIELGSRHAQKLRQQLVEVETSLQRLTGQSEALANLLVKAEAQRRTPELAHFEKKIPNKRTTNP